MLVLGTPARGAPRMANSPDLLLEHLPRANTLATSKLRGRTITVLGALPHCPDEPALRAVKYEGLQVLMKANGIPCTKYMGVPEFVTVVLVWLCVHPDNELCLPPGLSRLDMFLERVFGIALVLYAILCFRQERVRLLP